MRMGQNLKGIEKTMGEWDWGIFEKKDAENFKVILQMITHMDWDCY